MNWLVLGISDLMMIWSLSMFIFPKQWSNGLMNVRADIGKESSTMKQGRGRKDGGDFIKSCMDMTKTTTGLIRMTRHRRYLRKLRQLSYS